ncbi:hypothetical protein [Amycolatopsis saalfeldensis]|uniref:Uncharacterized protein n=1 Tax=Amycolatopsis saalfeldensis TaxID=394193 RepID=A0A1H8XNR5_9PSEU|nr:hypothetical protein [Amycolatopsis saalfeldensis]SEP41447.1 hypothetical protein SAMN04489732_108150 [Amycolatopsis saalfeldensis]
MLDDPIATTPSWRGFALTLTLISLLGVMFSLGLGSVCVMASDGCSGGDTRFICTASGQNTVFWLPLSGWATAIVGSLPIAGWASRRGWGPWAGLFAGALIYSVPAVAAYSIAAG